MPWARLWLLFHTRPAPGRGEAEAPRAAGNQLTYQATGDHMAGGLAVTRLAVVELLAPVSHYPLVATVTSRRDPERRRQVPPCVGCIRASPSAARRHADARKPEPVHTSPGAHVPGTDTAVTPAGDITQHPVSGASGAFRTGASSARSTPLPRPPGMPSPARRPPQVPPGGRDPTVSAASGQAQQLLHRWP
jgi:hypothetical protein